MEHRLDEVLIGEFQDRMKMLSDAVVRGNCPTIEEYRYMCGQLRGLEAACGIVEDLKKRMENSDD